MGKQTRKIIVCLCVFSCFTLFGCEQQDATTTEVVIHDKSESGLENSLYTLEDGTCPVQMPKFSSSFESVVINEINQEVADLHSMLYENIEDADNKVHINVWNFENERYLQSVINYVSYPLVGGYGDVTSYNYDRITDRRITLTDALIKKETTLDDVRQMVIDSCLKNQTLSEHKTAIYGATVDGFILDENDQCVFYGNVDLCINGSTQWSYVYKFDFETQEVEIFDLEL